ncbi:hypothetical protein SDC9_154944 [bioreactor metagenome]|uniref:Uncharacterized protein n=1 Tax=bioreactor metagenome TaxID=1076179 RepID=A0A645F541_9ZZZZ
MFAYLGPLLCGQKGFIHPLRADGEVSAVCRERQDFLDSGIEYDTGLRQQYGKRLSLIENPAAGGDNRSYRTVDIAKVDRDAGVSHAGGN